MRRATWVLLLMLALLPLRGWGAASMGLPSPTRPATALTTAAVQDDAAPMPPCHQGSEAAGAGMMNCQACDWCHAAMGLAPPGACPVASPPAVAPLRAVVRDTGRHAVGGLERPPRSFLA